MLTAADVIKGESNNNSQIFQEAFEAGDYVPSAEKKNWVVVVFLLPDYF